MIRFASPLFPSLLLPPLLGLSACGPAENDPGPGGVTVGEARALDDAADMIEQGRLPDTALEDGASANSSAKGTGAGNAPSSAPNAAPTPKPTKQ